MSAYYNDNDPFMVEWLRHLIKRGVIADGEVDGRSINEIDPKEISQFTQCHFFAGIGVWSYALRRIGWPDGVRVWTGSCPCPSFSASGERKGFSDSRHLWPAWGRLIAEHRPHVVFGEQVAKKDGRAWFDVVSSELEEIGYTVGAAAIPACGFGAPHIRERIYFVAHTDSAEFSQITSAWNEQVLRNNSHAGAVAIAERGRREQRDTEKRRVQKSRARSAARTVGEPSSSGLEGLARDVVDRDESRRIASQAYGPTPKAGPTNGYWADAVWIECSDGRLRAVPAEPAFFPVVDGLARGRVGLIRGSGNALVAPAAEAFIESFLEEIACR